MNLSLNPAQFLLGVEQEPASAKKMFKFEMNLSLNPAQFVLGVEQKPADLIFQGESICLRH